MFKNKGMNISSRLFKAFSVTKLIAILAVHFVILCCTDKVRLKCLTNWQVNKSSSLSATFSVTKFITILSVHFPHFVVLIKPNLDVQETKVWTKAQILNKRLISVLGLTKIIIIFILIWSCFVMLLKFFWC